MRADILVFPGSNCDVDTEIALREALPGWQVTRQWHDGADLSGSQFCVLPGGFAHGDYLRAGALAARSPAIEGVRALIARGGLVLGICNGFQVLVEAGILPGAFQANTVQHFICRDVALRVERAASPFLDAFAAGDVLTLPIAHQEGNYRLTEDEYRRLKDEGRIAFTYCGPHGETAGDYNPNGSYASVAGVLAEGGRVLGMMPHPERAAWPAIGRTDGLRILAAGLATAMQGGTL